MEDTETSSIVSNNSQSQPHWLQIAEYTALGASIVGSGFALVWEKISFVAPPITLALILNSINRKRFEEKIQTHINNEVEELRIDIDSVDRYSEKTQEKITELTPEYPINFSQNQSDFEFNTITKEDWDTINTKFSDIDEELQSLKDLTTDLHQDLGDNLQSTNYASMSNKIEELQGQVNKLQDLNRDLVRPYFIRLIRAVKQLQKIIKS
ncbi:MULTISPECIES: hypothetical protein [unclassified Okeania]|uniref:hypothetical protein n=1 Tax=unclassified Okeania TaxID=2634635 RepID=UPI0013BA450E|nr:MULTISPECIES: hypothetical protein [unclassified Okeania]NES74838.1 hypothetical protein [Okeania sp. SIO1H4]NET20838.1 hypothetical protein [Okeania sp. SIO1H5]NET91917.1 hypothetical protein [Okeania sp. SIO1H2]